MEERLAWSSLGFQAALEGLSPCEHATLPPAPSFPVRSVETRRALSEFECIFVSIAWELEVVDLVRALRGSGVEPSRALRPLSQPLVVAGGPLTLANPEALAGVCDAVFVGEADEWFSTLVNAVGSATGRDDALLRLARIPGVMVPAVHGPNSDAPEPVRAPPERLPVWSLLPHRPNVFNCSFLIEVGRGCPRACTFCVVGRGSRPVIFVPPEGILCRIPAGARRVGLVGAAVSDHPRLEEVVEALVSRQVQVTLSSLRADRVTKDLVLLLALGGLRTLTISADGTSEVLRAKVCKGITSDRLIECAHLARAAGLKELRLYLMVGLPDETEDDLREGAALVQNLAAILPVTVSVSAFVPKRRTPLGSAPFAGVSTLKRRIGVLRRLIGGTARFRAASPRIAEREWLLATSRGTQALSLVMRWISQGP